MHSSAHRQAPDDLVRVLGADLLIETAGGQLIGIEIKASATVTASDARHLAWLRDQTGDAFAVGIVLHTGPYVFPVSDRIVAAPMSTLWS